MFNAQHISYRAFYYIFLFMHLGQICAGLVCREPRLQRQFGLFEDDSVGRRVLVMTTLALKHLPSFRLAVGVVVVRAAVTFWPVKLEQRVSAALLGAALNEEFE